MRKARRERLSLSGVIAELLRLWTHSDPELLNLLKLWEAADEDEEIRKH